MASAFPVGAKPPVSSAPRDELWSHPRIELPREALNDRMGMAAEAASALARRKQSYPALVQAGKMEAKLADADIAAWQAIADDWHWIATGQTLDGDSAQPDSRALHTSLPARIIALETAIGRFFGVMDRSGGAQGVSLAQQQQITRLAAMRWWAEFELRQPAKLHDRHYAAIGHDWRKQDCRPTLGAIWAAQDGKAA